MAVIGFDTETHLITADNLTPRLVCLSLAGGPDTRDAMYAHVPGEADVWWNEDKAGNWRLVAGRDSAEGLLLAASLIATLVAHNLPFDLGIVRNEGYLSDATIAWGLQQGTYRDTMVREMLICIAQNNFEYDRRDGGRPPTGFPLSHLARVYLGRDLAAVKTGADAWRLRYSELDGVPVAQWPIAALEYAAEDAVLARQIYLLQGAQPLEVEGYPVVGKNGNVVDEGPQTRAAWALHCMAVTGVRVDPVRAAQFAAEVAVEAAKVHVAAKALGIERINRCGSCDGTGKVGDFPALQPCPTCNGWDHETCLYQKVYKRAAESGIGSTVKGRLQAIVRWGHKNSEEGVPMTAPTDTKPYGQVKTDAETLKDIDHDDVEAYVQSLGAIKLQTTYIPQLTAASATPSGRLVSRPNVLVRSGRTSWQAPNLQNPPRFGMFRECFVPAPGNVFCSLDYSGNELCALSQVCLDLFGHSTMATIINSGKDLHTWLGAEHFLHIPYEDGVKRLKAGDPEMKDKRQRAKVPNFGLPGGLGPAKLTKYAKQYGVKMTLEEAREVCYLWKQAFPEMREYFAMMSTASETSGGKFAIQQLRSKRVRGGCHYTSACNSWFQALSADGAKAAMWQLHIACYVDKASPLYGCRMWVFIHDEFIIEGPADTAHLWSVEAARLMVAEMVKWTPDVRSVAEETLMWRWYKGAERVVDSSGQVIPWVPVADLPAILRRVAAAMPKGAGVLWASYADAALRLGCDEAEAAEIANAEMQVQAA